MKNLAILFGGALAMIQSAHADVLPVPGPVDFVLMLAELVVITAVFFGVLFVIYKLYRLLRPKKNAIEKKKTAAKNKTK